MKSTALATFLLLLAASAQAQELAAGISRDAIEITSSFTGTDVVVFGAIESEVGDGLPASAYDIVVVIRSDRPHTVTVRKKDRVGPIWVNNETRSFAEVPGFYFVASTKPLKAIAGEEVLEELELGLDHLRLGPAPGTIGGPRTFREAIVRAKWRGQLYSEHPGGISFLSSTLFRTTALLPANVPAGNLKVTVFLFANGQVVEAGRSSTTLYIDKTGIERRLSNFARNDPWLYGLAAVILSVIAGFFAALAFRERE